MLFVYIIEKPNIRSYIKYNVYIGAGVKGHSIWI